MRSPRDYEARATYVYVIARADGLVKVGVSRNVARRRSSLQASTPDKLKVVHRVCPETLPALAVEAKAMGLLAPWKVSGEWFRCPAGLAQAAIDVAMRNGDASFFARWQTYDVTLAAWLAADRAEIYARKSSRDKETKAKALADERATRSVWAAVEAQLISDFPELARLAIGPRVVL